VIWHNGLNHFVNWFEIWECDLPITAINCWVTWH